MISTNGAILTSIHATRRRTYICVCNTTTERSNGIVDVGKSNRIL